MSSAISCCSCGRLPCFGEAKGSEVEAEKQQPFQVETVHKQSAAILGFYLSTTP